VPDVKRCAVPAGSLVERAFERVDYADAYEAPLGPNASRDVDAFTRRMLSSRPAWLNALMKTRDALAGAVGLEQVTVATGRSGFGFFELFARTGDELMLGKDDRHLDFRLSVLLRDSRAVLSTVVRFHGALGRAYFAPVKPFHRIIVRRLLGDAVS
jgi:hypothetical protein